MKKFYQLYRSPEIGQLRKRPVKTLLHGKPASGYRFINLGELQKRVSDVSLHSATCNNAIDLGSKRVSPVELVSEIDSFGLASVLSTKCHKEINLNTSPKLKINKKSRHFDING